MSKVDWAAAPEGAQFFSNQYFRKHEGGLEFFWVFGEWNNTIFDGLDWHSSKEDFETRPTQERTHPAAAHQYEHPADEVEWPITDSRIDTIGQNGGDGEHYGSQDLGQGVEGKDEMSSIYQKYYKDVSGIESLDVYGVHDLFGIDDPSGCIQHASKKLLLSGVRTGGKSAYQDIKEARDTLNRKLQLMEQAGEKN